MTVKECYEQMGADYEGVLGRLRSEALIKKFAKKFLDDGSFQSLKDNLAAGNGEEEQQKAVKNCLPKLRNSIRKLLMRSV